MIAIKRLLVLAPHTDDAELGCGGALARLLEAGVDIHVAAFSTANDSLPEGSAPTRLRDEFHEAMSVLGVPPENRHVYEYPVRRLSYHRQEVLDEAVALGKLVRPDAVWLPSGADIHQDHQVVHMEGLRAFKHNTVWGYELPWNHTTFSTQAFVCLEQRHLEKKWKCLQSYKTQIELKRPYFSKEFMEGLARVRGVQVRSDFAECFDVVRVRV